MHKYLCHIQDCKNNLFFSLSLHIKKNSFVVVVENLFNHLLIFVLRAPHWSVRMGYMFMKIDAWSDEYSYLIVDSKIKNEAIYGNSPGTQICGLTNQDYSDKINVNFTHNSTTMSIYITTNLD